MEKIVDNRTVKKIKQDNALLKQGDEIFRKVDFYKDTLKALGDMHGVIDERISKGYILTKVWVLGFIPVSKRLILDSYAIGKLSIEKIELKV